MVFDAVAPIGFALVEGEVHVSRSSSLYVNVTAVTVGLLPAP
jgi:hypothetical protein